MKIPPQTVHQAAESRKKSEDKETVQKARANDDTAETVESPKQGEKFRQCKAMNGKQRCVDGPIRAARLMVEAGSILACLVVCIGKKEWTKEEQPGYMAIMHHLLLALNLFESIVILIEKHGMINPAGILFRTLEELVVRGRWIAQEPDIRGRNFWDHDAKVMKWTKARLAHSPVEGGKTRERRPDFRRMLKELGEERRYCTHYRFLSDIAHGDMDIPKEFKETLLLESADRFYLIACTAAMFSREAKNICDTILMEANRAVQEEWKNKP